MRDADLAAGGRLKRNLWIAFEPDGSNTYGTLIDDVSLTTVEILQPKLEPDGTRASGAPVKTSAVRFARWHKGFTEPGGQFKQDWIKDDEVRVIIHLPENLIDESFPITKVTVNGIVGSDRAMDSGFVKLEKKNGGWESDPILFVVDKIDADKYNGDLPASQGFEHDQTRLAGFGADISVSVVLKGQSVFTEFPLGKMIKPVHTVKVELLILEAFGPVGNQDKLRAQEYFDTVRLLPGRSELTLCSKEQSMGYNCAKTLLPRLMRMVRLPIPP